MGLGSFLWKRTKRVDWTNLDCFERRLSRFFELYSGFVYRHPWPFIIIPILVSAGLSVGFFYRHDFSDATYLYTPLGAQSKYERACIQEKWPLMDGVYIPGKAVDPVREAQSIVMAKDGGNILRFECAEAIKRLNLFITDKIKVTYKNKIYTYNDLCLHWQDTCYTNSHVGLVSTVFNNPDPYWSNLTYPMANFGTDRGYLGSSLGGVRVSESNGTILDAKAWILLYQLQFEPDNISYISGMWEMEFQKQLLNYADPFIRITVLHSQTLSRELKRNAEKLAPRFAIVFGILVLFAMMVTFAFIDGSNVPYIDWVVSKPLLALLGVVGAGMGIGTTIGLLAFCGYMYNQIVSVMPFLIIAVRLDNTFIMISALRHISRSVPAERRITKSMAEASSAITITVSTDFFSFITGVVTDIPAVQVFCVYTALAVLITFVYQLTFMMALLCLAAKGEEKAQNAMFTCMTTVTPKEAKERGVFTRLFNQGSRAEVHQGLGEKEDNVMHANANPGTISRWFEEWYAPVLMHPACRVIVLVWFALYLGVSSYLCTNMRQGLEPVKLLVRDSYAIPHYKLLENVFWINGSEMQLVVNNAPNLGNKSEQQRVKDMVQAFASTHYSMGMASVQFWMFDYEQYLKDYGFSWILNGDLSPEEYYASVERFLSLNSYEKLRQDVVWSDNKLPNGNQTRPVIKSFRLSTGLSYFQTAVLQIETVNLMRSLTADPRWADMNITTFNPIWLFVDQYQEILPNVIQEVVSGVGFMILIALLLIPHPFISFWAALTILSVDLGVVGFMTLWDINLDTVSMLTIIMSIGFSVDFAAHVAHAFVVSSDKDDSLVDKVKKAMGEVAWPIIQGATSTLLGVIVLADLESYMVVAFFKTVFLVIILAVIHGLIFLPVLLSIFVPKRCGGRHHKKKSGSPREKQTDKNNGTIRSNGAIVHPTLDGASLFHTHSSADHRNIEMEMALKSTDHIGNGTGHFGNGVVRRGPIPDAGTIVQQHRASET